MAINLKITIPQKELDGIIIDSRTAAEAAARGIEVLIIEHLEDKNSRTEPNRYGLPKSNYYSNAAKDVSSTVSGSHATIAINHPGISLHYYGGTVLPKKKVLAIPIHPSVAGIWPSEYGGDMFVVWPKGKRSGLLVSADLRDEKNIGRALYRLVYKATIKADPTVLPKDEQLYAAAETAISEAMS